MLYVEKEFKDTMIIDILHTCNLAMQMILSSHNINKLYLFVLRFFTAGKFIVISKIKKLSCLAKNTHVGILFIIDNMNTSQ